MGKLFVLKEFALKDEEGSIVHFIAREPFSFEMLDDADRSRYFWCKNHHHGFSWQDGLVEYRKCEESIKDALSAYSVVYCKGLQKRTYLQKFADETTAAIINVKDLNLAFRLGDYEKSNPTCQFHNGVCALKNIDFIINNLNENFK